MKTTKIKSLERQAKDLTNQQWRIACFHALLRGQRKREARLRKGVK